MKKIMLIPPTELPIPSVGGGAIETLITNLINENEKEKQAEFLVISKYDAKAAAQSYQYTRILYFQNYTYTGKNSWIMKVLWLLYRVRVKLFRNRFVAKFTGSSGRRMDYFFFQVFLLAKWNRVTAIVNEGRWDEKKWEALTDLVGKEHVYNHIHCERKENVEARKVIPNSISIRQYVKKQWTLTPSIPGNNEVLYNCIDLDRFAKHPTTGQKTRLRAELGISDTEFIAVFCGRIIKEKGIIELLKCFDLLKGYPIKLLLIGSVGFSANTTSEYSEEVQHKAAAMDNVLSLGYIPNQMMPLYYEISDIQVIPSIWQEGAGLVAIEGMASGLPIVATKSGGMIEYLSEKNSIQIDINDELPDNLSKAILKLYHSPELCTSFAREGRNRAKRYSVQRYYKEFIEIVNT